MAEPDQVQVERQARDLGWVPQEEFRGNAEKWVDAQTFVSRGEEIMPILKANNRRLHQDVDALRRDLQTAQQTILASQEAMEALKTSQTEITKQAVKQTKVELRAKIREAREANDFELLEELEDQLDNVKDVERQVAATPVKPATPTTTQPPQPQIDPEYVAWAQENPWVETAPMRVKRMMVLEAAELRDEQPNLKGRAFYEEVGRRVDAQVNPRSTASRVDTGTGTAHPSRSSGGSVKRGYKDLPAEAKAICDRQAELLVGPGRAFKSLAEWQQSYAEQVFSE